MKGVSAITVFEILAHPDDLVISTHQHQDSKRGKWNLVFSRGPGHNGKILIETIPYYENKAASAEAVREILNGISNWAKNELESRSFDKVFNSAIIEQIVEKVCTEGIAATHEMPYFKKTA